MKILRLRTYFYPENAAASAMNEDFENELVKRKITSVNYTPVPSRGITDEVRKEYKKKKYEELKDGYVIVHRFSMIKEGTNVIQRTLKFMLCTIKEYIKGIRETDIDVLYGSSTPPTQGMLCGKVARKLSRKYGKKVPFVYSLQDIFPDSLVNAGITKTGSLIWKIGRKIEDATYRSADKIIVISESFKKNILAKGVPEDKIVVIPNWIDLDRMVPVDKNDNTLYEELKIGKTAFTVLYAGNFGEVQGGDIIIEAAEKLQDEKDIQFVIFGGGACFDGIRKAAAGLGNVQIFDLLPQERTAEVYGLADVGLLTCKAGTGNAGMPSKTWSMMAANIPIIASFDVGSELDGVLRASGAGKCIAPGDASRLADEIRKFYAASKSGDYRKPDTRTYVKTNFSKETCVKQYVDTITTVLERKPI